MFNTKDPNVAEAQKIMLDTLVMFHNFCQEHNLTYWLEGGTLLGAIRHKGFIPWDDDIDVAMPRDDYNKLCQIAPQYLNKKYFFQTPQTDKNYHLPIAKIRVNHTFCKEKHETMECTYHRGLFIDIIPIDTYDYTIFMKLMNFERNLRILKYSSTDTGYQKLLNKLYTDGIFLLPRKLLKLTRKILMKKKSLFNNPNSKYLSHGLEWGEVMYTKRSDIMPTKLAEDIFEGHSFFIPRNTHEYLTAYFDENYMTLPPIEQREIHHQKIIIYEEFYDK